MTTVDCRITYNDQNGWYNNSTGAFESAGTNGNMNMVPGGGWVFRFATQIPSGVTINSALLRLAYNTKFGDQNGSSNHTVYAEIQTKNSAPLVTSEQYLSRPKTFVLTANANIVANSGNNYFSVDVTSVVRKAYAEGLEVGGHMTFFVVCNSESGDLNWKMAADSDSPQLLIDYHNENQDGQFWDFNLLANPDFGNNTDHWGTNDLFGSHATTGAAWTRDTTFTRNGRPTFKWSCPTPEADKPCGPTGFVFLNVTNSAYIFSGWIYIPSTLTAEVQAGYTFTGTYTTISERDKWVPFSTLPLTNTNVTGVFPIIWIGPGYEANENIWLSDCAVYRSKFRQTPFVGSTPNQPEITHFAKDAPGRGLMVRRRVPKTNASDNMTKTVLDDCSSTSGWSNTTHNGLGVGFTTNGSKVTATVAANLGPPTPLAKLTKTLPMSQRYLGIENNNYAYGADAVTLMTVTTSSGTTLSRPPVVATEGNWKFYDMMGLGNVLTLEWGFDRDASAWTADFFEIASFTAPTTSTAPIFEPSLKYTLRSDGIWQPAGSTRESVSWDELEANTMSWDALKDTNKTWAQLETEGL